MTHNESSSERLPLSTTKISLLGICVILGNVIIGFNALAVHVALDGIAQSLKVKDGDLQWVVNSYSLVFVSIEAQSRVSYAVRTHILFNK
jgi:hypothetical protein